jgi:hypothetical protein
MDFDRWEKEKFYFCGWYRHKKGLYALVPLHRNLENFKAKITTKGNRTIRLASMGASESYHFVGVFQSLMQVGDEACAFFLS